MVGAAVPTASTSFGAATSAAACAAMRSVTRPRAVVTVDRTRMGRRWPMSMPRPAPMSTATTFVTVPAPMNMYCPFSQVKDLSTTQVLG